MKTRRRRCADCSEWIVVATKAGPVPKRCEACKAKARNKYHRDYYHANDGARRKEARGASKPTRPRGRGRPHKPKANAHAVVLCQCCGSPLGKARVEAGDPYCRRPSCERSRVVIEELKAERAAFEAAEQDAPRGFERSTGPEARPDMFNQVGPKHGETWDTDR